MKKVIGGILLIISIALILFFAWYNRNIQLLRDIKDFNNGYKEYLSKPITVDDLTTIMHKAIDNNNKYEIPKNSNGAYIDDGKYAIEIIVKPEQERKFISNGSF